MKIKLIIALIIIFLLAYFNSFSQTKKDLAQITKLVVVKCKENKLKVYRKFKNTELIAALEEYKDTLEYPSFEEIWDTLENTSKDGFENTLIVQIESIYFYLDLNLKKANAKNNKRIPKYDKLDLESNINERPIAFISIPIISTDTKKTIVFSSFICGVLCGEGGIYCLEKINKKWVITDYRIKWIS